MKSPRSPLWHKRREEEESVEVTADAFKVAPSASETEGGAPAPEDPPASESDEDERDDDSFSESSYSSYDDRRPIGRALSKGLRIATRPIRAVRGLGRKQSEEYYSSEEDEEYSSEEESTNYDSFSQSSRSVRRRGIFNRFRRRKAVAQGTSWYSDSSDDEKEENSETQEVVELEDDEAESSQEKNEDEPLQVSIQDKSSFSMGQAVEVSLEDVANRHLVAMDHKLCMDSFVESRDEEDDRYLASSPMDRRARLNIGFSVDVDDEDDTVEQPTLAESASKLSNVSSISHPRNAAPRELSPKEAYEMTYDEETHASRRDRDLAGASQADSRQTGYDGDDSKSEFTNTASKILGLKEVDEQSEVQPKVVEKAPTEEKHSSPHYRYIPTAFLDPTPKAGSAALKPSAFSTIDVAKKFIMGFANEETTDGDADDEASTAQPGDDAGEHKKPTPRGVDMAVQTSMTEEEDLTKENKKAKKKSWFRLKNQRRQKADRAVETRTLESSVALNTYMDYPVNETKDAAGVPGTHSLITETIAETNNDKESVVAPPSAPGTKVSKSSPSIASKAPSLSTRGVSGRPASAKSSARGIPTLLPKRTAKTVRERTYKEKPEGSPWKKKRPQLDPNSSMCSLPDTSIGPVPQLDGSVITAPVVTGPRRPEQKTILPVGMKTRPQLETAKKAEETPWDVLGILNNLFVNEVEEVPRSVPDVVETTEETGDLGADVEASSMVENHQEQHPPKSPTPRVASVFSFSKKKKDFNMKDLSISQASEGFDVQMTPRSRFPWKNKRKKQIRKTRAVSPKKTKCTTKDDPAPAKLPKAGKAPHRAPHKKSQVSTKSKKIPEPIDPPTSTSCRSCDDTPEMLHETKGNDDKIISVTKKTSDEKLTAAENEQVSEDVSKPKSPNGLSSLLGFFGFNGTTQATDRASIEQTDPSVEKRAEPHIDPQSHTVEIAIARDVHGDGDSKDGDKEEGTPLEGASIEKPGSSSAVDEYVETGARNVEDRPPADSENNPPFRDFTNPPPTDAASITESLPSPKLAETMSDFMEALFDNGQHKEASPTVKLPGKPTSSLHVLGIVPQNVDGGDQVTTASVDPSTTFGPGEDSVAVATRRPLPPVMKKGAKGFSKLFPRAPRSSKSVNRSPPKSESPQERTIDMMVPPVPSRSSTYQVEFCDDNITLNASGTKSMKETEEPVPIYQSDRKPWGFWRKSVPKNDIRIRGSDSVSLNDAVIAFPPRKGPTPPATVTTNIPPSAFEKEEPSVVGVSVSPTHRTGKSSALTGDTTMTGIEDAKQKVRDALKRVESPRAGGAELDDLYAVLSRESDDSSIGDVEDALNTLRMHAQRLGVRESDLLLAVKSEDSMFSDPMEDDLLSPRSMTLGEELIDTFSAYFSSRRK